MRAALSPRLLWLLHTQTNSQLDKGGGQKSDAKRPGEMPASLVRLLYPHSLSPFAVFGKMYNL